MPRQIFYSWQSDLPNSTNRGFILSAIEAAVQNIAADASIEEPVIQRDTQGSLGSPDIAATIFAKIDKTDVFIADISIIARHRKGRLTPNPNVLIELGYALKCLGHERVILVFNDAYGQLSDLPFDLRPRRILFYNLDKSSNEKSNVKKEVIKKLESHLRSILTSLGDSNEDTKASLAISALEDNAQNRKILLRNFLDNHLKEIDRLQPTKFSDGGTAAQLIDAINKTQKIVLDFVKVVEVIAVLKDAESAQYVYQWFGRLFERYSDPKLTHGIIPPNDHDYFKFLGYESFVIFIALLLREGNMPIIEILLDEKIAVKYTKDSTVPTEINWNYASQYMPLLAMESFQRRIASYHSVLLKERYNNSPLSQHISLSEFVEADFFLYVCEVGSPDYMEWFEWKPMSVLNIQGTPRFIIKARKVPFAQFLAHVANTKGVEELKNNLLTNYRVVGRLFSNCAWQLPNMQSDIEAIGKE